MENEGDNVNQMIFQTAAVDFMPPIDREDVIELAQVLDDVIDTVEDVMQHLYMYDVQSIPEDAKHFCELIRKSCKALDKAMEDFHNFKKSKKFRQLISDINT